MPSLFTHDSAILLMSTVWCAVLYCNVLLWYHICYYCYKHCCIIVHCESKKKLCHFYFYCNFGKCWSIFI